MTAPAARPMPREALRLLLRERSKRIRALQKRALSLIIDPVSLLYLLGFAVLTIAFARERLLQGVDLTPYAPLNGPLVALLLFFGFCWSGLLDVLKSSRYRFTYSDFLLHMLPHPTHAYVRATILRHEARNLLWFALLLTLLWLLETHWVQVELFTVPTLVLLAATYAIGNFARGLLQWHLYQKSTAVRLTLCISLTAVGGLGLLASLLFVDSARWLLLGLLLLMMPLIGWLWWRLPALVVDWQRVLTYGEEKTWNGFLIRLVVGATDASTPLHKPWVAAKHKPAPRRLPYHMHRLTCHMWWSWLWRDKRPLLVNLTFYLFLVQSVALQSGFPYSTGIAFLIASSLGAYMLAEVFSERLNQTPMRVLPWPLRETVTGYRTATLWILAPVLLPQFSALLLGNGARWYELLTLLLGQGLLFLAYYERTLARRATERLGYLRNPFANIFTWLLLVALLFAMLQLPLVAPVVGLLAYLWVSRQYN